jgi:glycosyltransferase involved in cell wall biosynthesis
MDPNFKPLVNVIIPTYNRAHLICKAIDSVLSQTYRNYEIIVIDDGSTDNTTDVLEKYKDKITYIYQENKGPGDARNRGINEARGKYLAFIDSDDTWFDYKLELQVTIMEKLLDISFLFSDFCIYKENGEHIRFGLQKWHRHLKAWNEIFSNSIRYSSIIKKGTNFEKDFVIFFGNLYYAQIFDPYVWPSGTIVRRECFDDINKFSEGVFLYEDWEFFAKLSRKHDAGFMDIETFFNRGHTDDVRLTHCSNIKKAENRLRLLKEVWKKDISFSKNFAKEIAEIESEQILILSKENLFNLRPKISRKIFSELKELHSYKLRYEMKMLRIFIYLPGGALLFRLIRILRRLFHKNWLPGID